MNRCPACGTIYADDARFCTKDGTKLMPKPGAPTPPVAARVVPAVAPPADPYSAMTPSRGTVAGRAEPPKPVTHTSLVDRTLDGRYQIEKKIGEGGMSFVYLATDISDNTSYAIKVLSPAL